MQLFKCMIIQKKNQHSFYYPTMLLNIQGVDLAFNFLRGDLVNTLKIQKNLS